MADYSKMTNEDFDSHLDDIVNSMSASELKAVPGVYDILREEFNNEVLDSWAEDNPEAYAFKYWIDHDERGEFRATVYDCDSNEVYSIDGFSIFEDGFMENKTDIDGLRDYLIDMGIMDDSQDLIIDSPKK